VHPRPVPSQRRPPDQGPADRSGRTGRGRARGTAQRGRARRHTPGWGRGADGCWGPAALRPHRCCHRAGGVHPPGWEGQLMDIDIAVLRQLEREREIPFETIVQAIEQALLMAYERVEGHFPNARVELDRKTGHVTVWAREPGEVDEETGLRGEPGPEFSDTPEGFGRVAAATARQVIVQRMR